MEMQSIIAACNDLQDRIDALYSEELRLSRIASSTSDHAMRWHIDSICLRLLRERHVLTDWREEIVNRAMRAA